MRLTRIPALVAGAVLGLALFTPPTPPASAQGIPKVCENGAVVGTPITGKWGRYTGVKLPASFSKSRDETHVTAQIYAIFLMRKDWACFSGNFPEATKVFEAHVKEMGQGG